MMAVMKYGDLLNVSGSLFKIKGLKFERMISKFLVLISDQLYAVFVTDMAQKFSICKLLMDSKVLKILRERFTPFMLPSSSLAIQAAQFQRVKFILAAKTNSMA